MEPDAADDTSVTWPARTSPPELRHLYFSEGHWNDETLGQLLGRLLHEHSSKAFCARSVIHPYSGTLGEVLGLARRLAGGLQERGLGPGDVVAFQLPNWVEAAAAFYGATLLGAVVAPIVHFYGPREVGYILRQSGARALVTADVFGHLDYPAMLAELRPSLPALETVAVVSTTGARLPAWALAFDDLVDAAPIGGPIPTDPDAPALVAYTSGTTAAPKGVVHSHRTIGFEVRQLAAAAPLGRPPLTGAPVGHGIGMLGALLVPLQRGQPVHLIDVWDPARVLEAMVQDQLVAGNGSTFFLTSLLDHPGFGTEHLALMAHIGLGGSAVPAAVGERAAALGISITRMYGSTEHPSTTGSDHDAPAAKRHFTDGRPLPGVELRVVDDRGAPTPAGVAGRIITRGPDCFIGYTDPALTEAAFDADGWYDSEDVGFLDDDGYLSITDRRKDIIIRGGENVSAAEVEEILLRLPSVAEAAVVAAPDPRLGEHACAFVRTRPETTPPDLVAIRAHLEAAGLARPKWPEELVIVDDFPRTASGKIQKFALRQRLRTPPRSGG